MHTYVYVIHLQQVCMHRFEICSKLIVGVGRKMGTFGRKLYLMCNLCVRACVCVCVCVCDVESVCACVCV